MSKTTPDTLTPVLALVRREWARMSDGRTRPEVTPTADIYTELEMDSLDACEIVMEAEKEFGVHILDAELVGIRTVADLAKLVEAKQRRKGKGA